MVIKKIEYNLTVCKVKAEMDIDLTKKFYFIGKTDEEISFEILRSESMYTANRETEVILRKNRKETGERIWQEQKVLP